MATTTMWFYLKVAFFVIVTTFLIFNYPYTPLGLFSLTELFLRSFDQPFELSFLYGYIGIMILNLATIPLVIYDMTPMDVVFFLGSLFLFWNFGTRFMLLIKLFQEL